MQSEKMDRTINLPYFMKSFLWLNEKLCSFSLFNGEFYLFDIFRKEPTIISTEKSYSSMIFNEQKEQIFCGQMISNVIDIFDLNAQKFRPFYSSSKNTEAFYKYLSFDLIDNNQILASMVLIKESKKKNNNKLVLHDLRTQKPIFKKNLPFKDICCVNTKGNYMAFSWNKDEIHSYSIINTNSILKNEKFFDELLTKECDSKLKAEDLSLINKETTSLAYSPSGSFLSLGKSNGCLSLYDISPSADLFLPSNLNLLIKAHQPLKFQQPGKLPEYTDVSICDIDFFPKLFEGKENRLVSSGKQGSLKFMNFDKRKVYGNLDWEVDQSGNYVGGYFEKVKWGPSGKYMMLLKSPDDNKKDFNECIMNVLESPFK